MKTEVYLVRMIGTRMTRMRRIKRILYLLRKYLEKPGCNLFFIACEASKIRLIRRIRVIRVSIIRLDTRYDSLTKPFLQKALPSSIQEQHHSIPLPMHRKQE